MEGGIDPRARSSVSVPLVIHYTYAKSRAMEQPASRTIPLDVILVVAEYSTLQGILPLTQTCRLLRHRCASIHLKQLGILNSATTKIHLVGGPFSAPVVSLLQCLTPIRPSLFDSPRMFLVIDFYHVTSFLCAIQRLLKTNTITSVELVILDDELSLLDNYNLSGSLLNALSHLPCHCQRLRFNAGPEHLSRPSLRQHWIPVYTPKPGRASIRRALAALTEVHLSLPLFYRCSLGNSIFFLLHHPKLTSFSLTCSNAIESEDVLSKACLPALENLTVRASDASLVVLPRIFMRSHSNLRNIYLSAIFHWNEDSFKPSGTCITLPSLASATISSKYAAFDIVNSSSLLDLHVYSFMAFPIPENRGYCNVVRSLVDIWLHSKPFLPVESFTASFTFPHRLSNHLAFCANVPVYQCSCIQATPVRKKLVHGVRRIKIFLDNVTQAVVVGLSFPCPED